MSPERENINPDLAEVLRLISEGERVVAPGANLRDANLSSANLRRANLNFANLNFADLRKADLRDADLWRASLFQANLGAANLLRANLNFADLSFADLRKADLSDADLWRASLERADLTDSEGIVCFPEIGSRKDTLFAVLHTNPEENIIMYKTGGFWGPEDKLLAAIKELHGKNKYAKEYQAAIDQAKKLLLEKKAARRT